MIEKIKENKKDINKVKKFRFGNKIEKLKRMTKYDKIYEEEMSMLY